MDYALNKADRDDSHLGAAFLLSAGLHVLMAGFLLFFVPRAESRKPDLGEVVTVQLLGSLSPPAPPAPPAPVDPELKGPDVVEAPPSEPVLSQPPPPEPTPMPEPTPLAAPAEVIPLGPKAPEKPVPQKAPDPPPKVTPPKVAPEPPPKPKPQARPNNEAEINRRIAELKRKQEADQLDAAIDSRMLNIAQNLGRGQGESSEPSGGTSGSQRVHPEKEAYYRQIQDIVRHNWLPPAGSLGAGLQAIFVIRIEPDGRVSSLRLDRSSGSADFDLSVERAIGRSNLPPLPQIFEGQADTPGLRFGLEDMRRG